MRRACEKRPARRSRQRRLAALALGALLATGLVRADDDEERERPRDLAPLAHLLAHIHGRYPGEVLKVELERERLGDLRLWIYEIKLLTPAGDVLKLSYDARSLELLRQRGHGIVGDDSDEHEETPEHDDGQEHDDQED